MKITKRFQFQTVCARFTEPVIIRIFLGQLRQNGNKASFRQQLQFYILTTEL